MSKESESRTEEELVGTEPGSITSLLDHKYEDVSNEIMIKVLGRYGDLWEYLVRMLLPDDKKRSGDIQDAVQETLKALHIQLLKPDCKFQTGRDIKNWTSRVAKNKGVDHVRKNSRIDGASSVPSPKKEGQATTAPNANLGEAAVQQVWRDLTSIERALQSELVLQMEELDRHVDDVLSSWSRHEQDIVRCWLDWMSYRSIMDKFSMTSRGVQEVTYDFITTTTIVNRVEKIRDGLFALAESAPRDASQCAPNCKCHRILVDHRGRP